MFFGATSSASSGWQLLPAHAVAQRDRHGALGGRLADDVLVELGDDLPRRQRRRSRSAWSRAGRWARSQDRELQFFDDDVRVRVDADLAGNRHRLLGDGRGRRARCCWASARAAASAYGPPDPIATIPSSGSMRSPVPDSRNVELAVEHDQHRLEAAQHAIACASRAPARRPSARDCRDTLASLASKRRTARTSRPPSRRTRPESGRCTAAGSSWRRCLTTVWPKVTWPSPASTARSRMPHRENRRAVDHRVSDCIGPAIRVSRKRDAARAPQGRPSEPWRSERDSRFSGHPVVPRLAGGLLLRWSSWSSRGRDTKGTNANHKPRCKRLDASDGRRTERRCS